MEHNNKAFLSYSHKDLDVARVLQRGLQRFGKPWNRTRAFRVFRDETNLPATPALWEKILAELRSSEFFILLASPNAACSKWVDRETSAWLEQGDGALERLLIVLVSGEIKWTNDEPDWERITALPQALRGVLTREPLYVRLPSNTPGGSPEYESAFQEALASLAAPLHGVRKEELFGMEVVEQHKRRRFAFTVAGVLLGLSVALGVASRVAHNNAVRAGENEERAIEARNVAQAGQAAANALARVEDQPQLSLLLAAASLEELNAMDSQPLPTTESALRLALGSVGGVPVTSHGSQLMYMAWPREDLFLAVDYDGGITTTPWPPRPSGPAGPANVIRRHERPSHVQVAPDGRWLLTVDFQTAYLWLLEGAQPASASTRLPLPGQVSRSSWHPGGRDVVIDGHPGWSRTFDVTTSEPREVEWRDRSGNPIPIASAVHSPDGQLLAAATVEGRLAVWEYTSEGTSLSFLSSQTGPYEPVVFSPDSSLLVTHPNGVQGGSPRIWKRSPEGSPPDTPWSVVADLPDAIRFIGSAVFSEDGNRLQIDTKRELWVWSNEPLKDGRHAHRLVGDMGLFRAFSCSDDTRWVAGKESGRETGRAVLWSCEGELERTVLDLSFLGPESLEQFAFTPDGERLIGVAMDGTALIWELDPEVSGPVILPGRSGPATSWYAKRPLIIDEHGTRLITLDDTGRLRHWRLSGKGMDPTPDLILGDDSRYTIAEFDRSRSWFVAATEEGGVRAWPVDSIGVNSEPRVVECDARFDFSGDGSRLACSLPGEGYRVYDLDSECVHLEPVASLAQSASLSEVQLAGDGRWLVARDPGESPKRSQGDATPPRLLLWDTHAPHEVPQVLASGQVLWYRDAQRRRCTFRARPGTLVTVDLASDAPVVKRGGAFLKGDPIPPSPGEGHPTGRWVTIVRDAGGTVLVDLDHLDDDDAHVEVSSVASRTRFSADGRWALALPVSIEPAVLVALPRGQDGAPKKARRLPIERAKLVDAFLAPEGDWLVTVHESGRLMRWDLREHDLKPEELGAYGAEHPTVAFSADGRWVTCADSSGLGQLWSLDRDRSPGRSFCKNERGSEAVYRIGARSLYLVTATSGTLQLSSLRDDPDASRRTLLEDAKLKGFISSPDERWLVTLGIAPPRLWQLDPSGAGVVAERHLGGRGVLEFAMFSEDGRWLVGLPYEGSSARQSLQLWNLAARPDYGEALPFTEIPCDTMSWDIVGEHLYAFSSSAGRTRELRVVDLSLERLARRARRIAGRSLTETEWGQYFPDHERQ